MNFDYQSAFSRNIGWVTEEEQKLIKNTTIAIAGMGGVGGHHLHALIRIGFEKFKIADFDQFELQNFNRQFGASISSIRKSKVDVLKKIALDINPDAHICVFESGITLENRDDFLKDVDIVCDGLDLYASDLRTPLYDRAHELGKYVLSSGPFGMGTALVIFHPKGIKFSEYFDLDIKGLSVEGKIIRFLAGMSPHLLHSTYVASPQSVDLFGGRLPSLNVGCYAASSAMSSAVLKIILKRGKLRFAPKGYQVDFYRNKWKNFWRPFGNRNPLQRILIRAMHHKFKVREFN